MESVEGVPDGKTVWKCRKDIDTRRTKRRGETCYGNMNHSKVCAKTKVVLAHETTSTGVHGSKEVTALPTEEDKGGLVS